MTSQFLFYVHFMFHITIVKSYIAIPTTRGNAKRYLCALEVPEVKLPILQRVRVVTNLKRGGGRGGVAS